eukprot:3669675-Amphidinium_carterae.1
MLLSPPAGLDVSFSHELSVWLFASTHHSLSVRLNKPFVGPPFAIVGIGAALANALGTAYMAALPDSQLHALVRAQGMVQRYSYGASNQGQYVLNDKEAAAMQRDISGLVGNSDFTRAIASAIWIMTQPVTQEVPHATILGAQSAQSIIDSEVVHPELVKAYNRIKNADDGSAAVALAVRNALA